MGSNLNPDIRDPRKRYESDGGKKAVHRDGRNPAFRKSFEKNAGELFGESPNLRKK